MPDILIRMEMPKSCVDCHDADLPTAIAWLEAKCPCAYGMNKQGVHDLRNKRHPDCPLHELPPHGDLIDRDEFVKSQCNSCDGSCECVECDCLNCEQSCRCDLIVDAMNAPVIVPAGREGEDATD